MSPGAQRDQLTPSPDHPHIIPTVRRGAPCPARVATWAKSSTKSHDLGSTIRWARSCSPLTPLR
eukprot:6254172-Amphidinium_carterae.1